MEGLNPILDCVCEIDGYMPCAQLVASIFFNLFFLKNIPVHVNASVLGFSKQCAQDLISTALDAIWSPLSCH